MNKRFYTVLLFPILVTTCTPGQSTYESQNDQFFKIHCDSIDTQEAVRMRLWLKEGRQSIIEFFNDEYKGKFDVYLFSDRESLDKHWQEDWNMPTFKSQCWMVASGVANRLDVLSPRVWDTQACEHDVQDTSAIRKLIIHEMVHVFHGQLNPSPTFEDIDNMDWYIEGIAVYASGQLDEKRYEDVRNLVHSKGGPVMLSDIWKGNNKYGLAGSLIKYLDDNYGRIALVHILTLTKAIEVLDYLGISEEELIQRWTMSIR